MLQKSSSFKKCEIDGCERRHCGKGLCVMHYLRVRRGVADMRPEPLPRLGRRWGKRKRKENCTIDGCDNPHYAKGYCHNHYEKNRRNGDPLFKKCLIPKLVCKVEGCDVISKVKGFCKFHYGRSIKGIELTRKKGNNGELNYRWNGGIACYPDHHKMKKRRLIVLERDNYKCFSCGKKANEVHHLDLSKNNHSFENLVASCHKCNSKHRNPSVNYKDIYGRYGVQIQKELNISTNHLQHLHNNGELKKTILK